MKFRLSFKTPDVEEQLDEEEREVAKIVISKFVEYGEYIRVEFDTENETAHVVPNRR